MAMIAYGSITILDLVDTATYIYYADDIGGANPSVSPKGKKYIGIYSGEPFPNGQPVSPPSGTVWSQYVGPEGPEGPKGETGNGIQSTDTTYGVSDSEEDIPNNWENTIADANPQPGQYLWTRVIFTYTNGEESEPSYSVSRVGQDGVNANAYVLESSQEEILKFYKKVSGEQQLVVTPSELSFVLYKIENEQKILESLKNSYSYELSIRYGSENPEEVTKYYTIDDNGKLVFSVEGFVNDIITKNINSLFLKENPILFLKITKNGNWIAEKAIQIRYGLSSEMASFAITESEITAAIQETGMSFGASGLTLVNGGLQIINSKEGEEDETVFYFDNELGRLVISGDLVAAGGTFSGELKAASGNFAGDISAATGKIGGFMIDEEELYADIYKPEEDQSAANSVLRLIGSEGKIIAQNIEIGTGALIQEYIQLGDNVKIYNPKAPNSNGNFISVTNKDEKNNVHNVFQINEQGNMTLNDGQLVLNGSEGTISSNLGDFTGWQLSSDESILNNVTIRGTIKASIIEYGEVQSVGGIILVRPSGKIKSIETETDQQKKWFYIQPFTGFEENDWCLIQKGNIENEDSKIWVQISEKIIEADGTCKICFNEEIVDSETLKECTIVSFGYNDSETKQNYIGLALNGSDNGSLVQPNCLSVFEYENEGNKINTKIILGKIPEGERFGDIANSYGLYAENAWIKGSLVSEGAPGENNYAGITSGTGTTIGYSNGKYFPKSTSSAIILWAGASEYTSTGIQDANFYVDKNGNMYANSGYFEGSIITDAEITAATLKTATIIGTGNNPALTIKDAANGIHFYRTEKEKDGNGNETHQDFSVFELNNDNITANVSNIVFNDNFKIEKSGKLLVPYLFIDNSESSSGLALDKNQIYYIPEEITKYPSYSERASAISLNETSISFKIGITSNLDIISSQNISHSDMLFENSVKMGEKMEYRKAIKNNTDIGYNLFIIE